MLILWINGIIKSESFMFKNAIGMDGIWESESGKEWSGNMSVVGIISEYNPFHEGHKFHIQKAKELTGSDTVAVVMNGDFVQRGEPAVVDKYTRTKMALAGGADLVFELPVRYGLSSAEDFAYGSILALESLSFVDHYCFGSECGEQELLKNAGQFFAREPEKYRLSLNRYLKDGMSYPAAREQAYVQCAAGGKYLSQRQREQLFSPNSILGIEYIKAAERIQSHMKPVIIERQGMGYNEEDTGSAGEGDFLSATAIRKEIRNGQFPGMPEQAREILMETGNFSEPEDFWRMCSYAIRDKWDDLEHYKDVSVELANAFRKNWYGALSLNHFVNCCKTKNYTMSRIKRCVFQILLGIEKEAGDEKTFPYIRLLGMKKEAAGYLKEVDGTQILGRLSRDIQKLEETARQKFGQDLKASDLYRSVSMSRGRAVQPDEFSRPLIIV